MATKIAWTNETWNPIVGCSKCSPGCANCYAEKMAFRLARMGQPQYNRSVYMGGGGWNGTTHFVESALSKPLHWRAPRKIFVCSMGDLFHESVPFEWIKKVRDIIVQCPQHTFQLLTKRPERMKEFTQWLAGQDDISIAEWPRNVWLGVTAENQEMADQRIPLLLQTPAALRFVSVEPMLGAVDLTKWLAPFTNCDHYNGGCTRTENVFACSSDPVQREGKLSCDTEKCPFGRRSIDWVIVGAESGAGRRKCSNDWASAIVEQCITAKVPCFVKQLHANGTTDLIKEPKGWPREFPEQGASK